MNVSALQLEKQPAEYLEVEVLTGAAVRGPGRPRQREISGKVLATVGEMIDAGLEVHLDEVVSRSGVSKTAIYRRWSTLNHVIADALNAGRAQLDVSGYQTVRETIRAVYPVKPADASVLYSELRMRRRLVLGLENAELQYEYWDSHAMRRRVPLRSVFEHGIQSGELRDDVDIEAALDLLSGLYYYQLVIRGASLQDEVTLNRCRSALEILWRGMSVGDQPLWGSAE